MSVCAVKRAFVIGHPVAHSRSPLLHGHWLDQLGIPGTYEAIDISPADLSGFLRTFGGEGFAGGNVTIPHKEAAFRLLEEATPAARRLGAVNTVWLEEGRVVGHNTDGEGFLASLDEGVGTGWRSDVQSALVVGAGGAARAIVAALVDIGLPQVLLCNRTEERAVRLVGLGPEVISVVAWDDRNAMLEHADLLVNTTQCGMKGHPALDIDVSRLPAHATVADIVYVPLETPLLAAARRQGLRAVGGLGMLMHQAVPGFARWFGQSPSVTAELRALLEADVRRGT